MSCTVARGHRPVGEGDRLVEQRERIAHRALGSAGDQRQRLGLGVDPLAAADCRQVARQRVAVHPPQVEALAARQHRDRDLADLGRGEDELGVRRRLLERLQQRVEGLVGQHVDFVEDVDLVARRGRPERDALMQLAHVVDAGMRGGVELDHVDAIGPRCSRGRTGRRRRAPASARRCRRVRCSSAPRAMIRAVVVLPTPRMPVSRKACAIRPEAKALLSVRTSASWPISSERRVGR